MRAAALIFVFGAVACANSTPRPLPSNTIPAGWEQAAATGTSTASSAWWEGFEDPVLTSLITRARAQNLDLKIAAARIREARSLENGAGAELWPSLDASAEASAARRSNRFALGLGASWEADLFGRLRAEERAAIAEAMATETDRDAAELVLLAEVAEAYVEYRLRRVQLSLSMKTAEAQASTVRITRARFEQGTASGFDVERTLAALALTRARIPEAEELSAAARHRLAVLLAEPSDQVTRELANDAPMPDTDPFAVLESPADVVANRPDVRSAEWRLRSALARRDAAVALRYPRLSLSGVLGVENERIQDLFNPASVIWSIGAGLLAPIFDFGRVRAQIDAANAREEQAYLTYERTVREAIEETQTAIIFYAQGVVKQKELGAAFASAQKAAEFARIQYREGTLSLLEVLDAERGLNDAQLSWTQATADVSLRLIGIHRALGG